ncbi:hypothetical protein DNTS_006020 [Danionella cerebrum]|uniref:Uncharacterized protein n=1 Tax=Danionella cerebrum TaxID=2873325 RepID=A0A553NWI0_9TELE|nr:hypothetical protein DNTS_006020 [Danionella translucida]
MPQSAQKTEPVSILQPQTTVNPDRVKQLLISGQEPQLLRLQPNGESRDMADN